MKSAPAASLALCLVLIAALLTGGCAYTTVAARERIPPPGPVVPAGLSAVMVPIQDSRPWPGQVSASPIPNVRIFAPQMTEAVRKGLLERGTFALLAPPLSPEAKDLGNTLRIEIKGFLLTNLGTNAWVVPHLLVNGALLPFFSGTLIGGQGRVDMGGYLLPSTRMGTTVTARMLYREAGYEAPVLEREYLVKLEMDSVSERSLIRGVGKGETYGVEIGKEQGDQTLTLFIETIARDPRWGFLPEFRRLVKADAATTEGTTLAKRLETAGELLDLLRPLTYTEEEVKVLRDGYLDAKARSTIINDIRAQWLDLANIKDLPSEMVVSEQRAEDLFNDPALPKAEVESVLAEKALGLLLKVLTQDDKGAQAVAQKDRLKAQLAAKLKGQPRLQSLLLLQADKKIGAEWAPTKTVLQAVDAPLVNKYLSKRS